MDEKDRALGAVLGACVGDAAGAPLEFRDAPPREDEVQRALTLPGGGPFRLAPGQITDDGELTLCLARALVGASAFPLEEIARRYAGWMRSRPFDCGATTRTALEVAAGPDGLAAAMAATARAHCAASKANGSLMRASPLGVWGRRLPPEALAECARSDARLSHPNPCCADAVACYALAIAELVRSGDRAAAFTLAQDWAQEHAVEEVQGWLYDAAAGAEIAFYPMVGFVRIAFTAAFSALARGSGYVEALERTLRGGGDTDTNACIVGGLIGAACGASAIPEAMRARTLDCTTLGGTKVRPETLRAAQVPALVEALLVSGPGSATSPTAAP